MKNIRYELTKNQKYDLYYKEVDDPENTDLWGSVEEFAAQKIELFLDTKNKTACWLFYKGSTDNGQINDDYEAVVKWLYLETGVAIE